MTWCRIGGQILPEPMLAHFTSAQYVALGVEESTRLLYKTSVALRQLLHNHLSLRGGTQTLSISSFH